MIAILALVLVAAMVLSLHLGVRQNTPQQVWTAVFGGGTESDSLVIATLRVPRMLLAPLVGAALGLAGLLLQTVTRNPLASPDLLGVNAGAAFAVVLAVYFFNVTAILPLAVLAAVGALCATALVFVLSASAGGSLTPTNTLLAGVTLASFLASGTQVMLVTDESTMENLIFWLSGGFADRDPVLTQFGAPIVLMCAMAGALLARPLDLLLADDASAHALGVPVMPLRIGALVIASILTGAAVTLAGPVAFVGLVAPHIARRLGGLSHAVVIPLTLLAGGTLAMAADIAARLVIHPSEAPVGAVLAFVGVPTLVVLLQSRSAQKGLSG